MTDKITITASDFPDNAAHGHLRGDRRYVHLHIHDPSAPFKHGGNISGYVSEAVWQYLNERLNVRETEESVHV